VDLSISTDHYFDVESVLMDFKYDAGVAYSQDPLRDSYRVTLLF
jgi:hypothetical protein